MNTLTSSHLREYKRLHVDILIQEGNTTTYIIRETQGAEYGQEAESVRQRFEASLRASSVITNEATSEDFQQWLDIDCADMGREDYRDLLHEIKGECTARLNALDEDETE